MPSESDMHPEATGTAGPASPIPPVQHLCRVDARLAQLIERVGPYALPVTRQPFVALIGSIVHQQVSMSAAAAILRRLRSRCGGRLSPRAILRLSAASLRGVGLSRQKAAYVRNIAKAFARRTVSAAKLRRMPDEDVIAAVTAIQGVGRWTAEMLLIFCLERPDVWPVDDFGLRKAMQIFLGLGALPTPAAIRDAGDRWRPYRSCATWYLWRSLDAPRLPSVTL